MPSPVKRKHNRWTFTYDGGLKVYEIEYESVKPFIPALDPALKPISVYGSNTTLRIPAVPKRSIAWWRAQCIFRGLPSAKSIEDAQGYLRELGDISMIYALAELEKDMSVEYERKKKIQNETEDTSEGQLEKQAEEESDGENKDDSNSREIKTKLQDEIEKAHLEVQSYRLQESSREGYKVMGSWSITCLAIQEKFDGYDNLRLRICIQDNVTAEYTQIFAEFDFGIASGIFRFENQPEHMPLLHTRPPRRQGEVRDPDVEYIEVDDRASRAFLLPLGTTPKGQTPTWNYRWRGENRDGSLYLGSDENLYSISFAGARGTELEGTFGGGPWGDCTFTGVQISLGQSNIIDPIAEWEARSPLEQLD